jgi:hypothetical protein
MGLVARMHWVFDQGAECVLIHDGVSATTSPADVATNFVSRTCGYGNVNTWVTSPWRCSNKEAISPWSETHLTLPSLPMVFLELEITSREDDETMDWPE